MKKISSLSVVLTIGLAGLACSTESRENHVLLEPEPEGAGMTITNDEGAYESASPATLRLYAGSPVTAELRVSGRIGDKLWNVFVPIDPGTLEAGSHTVTLGEGPMAQAQGLPTVALESGPGAAEWASSGTLTFELSAGRISGSVEAVPASVAASFQGDLVVSCWVPESALGRAPEGPGDRSDDGEDEGLVEDAELVSTQCAALRGLRAR